MSLKVAKMIIFCTGTNSKICRKSPWILLEFSILRNCYIFVEFQHWNSQKSQISNIQTVEFPTFSHIHIGIPRFPQFQHWKYGKIWEFSHKYWKSTRDRKVLFSRWKVNYIENGQRGRVGEVFLQVRFFLFAI